jgi:hypothetical protein
MTRFPKALLTLAVLAPAISRAEVPILESKDAIVSVGGLTQMIGFGQTLNDPYTNNSRAYLFMKESRFLAHGRYRDLQMNLEMALGGENAVSAASGVSLSLLELNVDVPLGFMGEHSYVRVGQFKVPYGRERLTYSGASQFLERSVTDQAFRIGWDVGVAIVYHPSKFALIGGIFTGGGRDVPPAHYLPERLGIPQLVVRTGYGDVDDDLFALRNTLHPTALKTAVFVNAMYTKDSTIGHSSVFNVKLAEKSWMLNSNWNPYVGKSPLSKGDWWQVGGDVAIRAPLSAITSFSGEAEFNWAGFSNDYGVVHAAGARAQGGVMIKNFEIALRYAVVFPDKKFANSGQAITKNGDPLHEITPSAAWYIAGQNLKLVADLPILLQVPVFTEKGVGSYVSSELPDQASILKTAGNTVGRQNIVEARLMFQAAF